MADSYLMGQSGGGTIVIPNVSSLINGYDDSFWTVKDVAYVQKTTWNRLFYLTSVPYFNTINYNSALAYVDFYSNSGHEYYVLGELEEEIPWLYFGGIQGDLKISQDTNGVFGIYGKLRDSSVFTSLNISIFPNSNSFNVATIIPYNQ